MLQLQYVQDRHMRYNHFICPFLPHLSLQTVVCVGEKKAQALQPSQYQSR